MSKMNKIFKIASGIILITTVLLILAPPKTSRANGNEMINTFTVNDTVQFAYTGGAQTPPAGPDSIVIRDGGPTGAVVGVVQTGGATSSTGGQVGGTNDFVFTKTYTAKVSTADFTVTDQQLKDEEEQKWFACSLFGGVNSCNTVNFVNGATNITVNVKGFSGFSTTNPPPSSTTLIPAGCPGSSLDGPLAPGTNCPGINTDGGGAMSTAAQEQQIGLSCSISILNPLTWLVCPIVTAANGFVAYLDTEINNLLNINGCSFLNPSEAQDLNNTDPTGAACGAGNQTSESYYTAWKSLRTIAIGMVVIMALIMIIAQALGFELFDAYTIKKVLPRMLIAVIGISLSWQLVQVMVQISNDIGNGVRFLIYQPFIPQFTTFTINPTDSFALTIIGGAALIGFGLIGLLSFALTAALAVVIGFALLTFREIFIIFMAIFAPIAIACFILPSTEKVWKFWWENFSKALIMFPIIAAFIAIGRVFAVTATQGNSGAVQLGTAMVAYFGPYFLIPFTFKWAGGLLSATGSLASRAQKNFGRPLADFRTNQRKQRAQKAKSGNLMRNTNRVSSGISKLAQAGALAPRAGLNPTRWKSKMGAELIKANKAQADELVSGKNAEFNAVLPDDEKLMATKFGRNRREIEDILTDFGHNGRFEDPGELAQAVAVVEAAQKTSSPEAVKIAAEMGRAGTGTGFKDAEEVSKSVAATAGGNELLSGMMLGTMRQIGASTNRPDLWKMGFADQAKELNKSNKQVKDPTQTGANGKFLTEQALANTTPGELVQARASAIHAFAPIMLDNVSKAAQNRERYKNLPRNDDRLVRADKELANALATVAGAHDAMGAAAPEKAGVLRDVVLSAHVVGVRDRNNQPATVHSLIDDHRDNDYFQEQRREYTQRAATQATQNIAHAAAVAAAAAGGTPPAQPGATGHNITPTDYTGGGGG